MAGWQVTAKTIYCEAVDDEVTLMVYKDAAALCTGCKKYTRPNALTRAATREKTRRLKRPVKCRGEQCPRIIEYKTQILSEEKQ